MTGRRLHKKRRHKASALTVRICEEGLTASSLGVSNIPAQLQAVQPEFATVPFQFSVSLPYFSAVGSDFTGSRSVSKIAAKFPAFRPYLAAVSAKLPLVVINFPDLPPDFHAISFHFRIFRRLCRRCSDGTRYQDAACQYL